MRNAKLASSETRQEFRQKVSKLETESLGDFCYIPFFLPLSTLRGEGGEGLKNRSGLTLFELLLVLAIIVMFAALAIGPVQRGLDQQKLAYTADIIRARCTQARASAMRESQVYAFIYTPGTPQYQVAPLDATSLDNAAIDFSSPEKSDTPNHPFSQRTLPGNIRFASGQQINDTRSDLALEQADLDAQDTQKILFYPDGQSQTASIDLMNEQTGDTIRIRIRGLTGTSSVETE